MFFVLVNVPMQWKWVVLDLPWGGLKIYFSNEGIGHVVLPGSSFKPAGEATAADKLPWPELKEELHSYFQGEEIRGSYPLLAGGYTPWTLKVLQLTAQIPFGETRSYGEIALAAGSGRGARAVGQAMARNNTPVLIPCHRVVGKNGALGGFSSGLDWKQRLLALEGDTLLSMTPSFFK